MEDPGGYEGWDAVVGAPPRPADLHPDKRPRPTAHRDPGRKSSKVPAASECSVACPARRASHGQQAFGGDHVPQRLGLVQAGDLVEAAEPAR